MAAVYYCDVRNCQLPAVLVLYKYYAPCEKRFEYLGRRGQIERPFTRRMPFFDSTTEGKKRLEIYVAPSL